LGLTLTQRQGVPMCGVPFHAAQTYIQRLIAGGHKIAICEQTSQPTKGKSLVERRVIEVLSPGTVVDDAYLDGSVNNYLLSVSRPIVGQCAVAFLDLSTGELGVRLFGLAELADQLSTEFAIRSPAELVVQESLLEESPSLASELGRRP